MVVTEPSCQCSGCCKGPEGWAAVKEKQMTLGGLYNAGWSELCHRVHLAPRPGGRGFLSGDVIGWGLSCGGQKMKSLWHNSVLSSAVRSHRALLLRWIMTHQNNRSAAHTAPPLASFLLKITHDQSGSATRGSNRKHTHKLAHSSKVCVSDYGTHFSSFHCLWEHFLIWYVYIWRRMWLPVVNFGLVQKQRNVNQSGSFRLKKYFVTAIIQTALLVFWWWMLMENDKYLINHKTG